MFPHRFRDMSFKGNVRAEWKPNIDSSSAYRHPSVQNTNRPKLSKIVLLHKTLVWTLSHPLIKPWCKKTDRKLLLIDTFQNTNIQQETFRSDQTTNRPSWRIRVLIRPHRSSLRHRRCLFEVWRVLTCVTISVLGRPRLPDFCQHLHYACMHQFLFSSPVSNHIW